VELLSGLTVAQHLHHVHGVAVLGHVAGVHVEGAVLLLGEPLGDQQRGVLVQLLDGDLRDRVLGLLRRGEAVFAQRRVVVVLVFVPTGGAATTAVAGPAVVFVRAAAACARAALAFLLTRHYRIASSRLSISSVV
jgi:hypothetical protein